MSIKRRLARAICVLTLAAAASPLVAQPAHLVRDILTGNDSFAGDANPSALTPFGAKLAFVAFEESIGVEVWISDSESRRTYLLADICRGYCTDGPEIVGAVGSTLFFIEARSQYAERLLWASDGTPRGTHPVLDGTEVLAYAMLPDQLVFLAGSPVKLWRIDGTGSAATELASVTDFQSVRGFTVSGNRAFLLLRNYTSKLLVWSTDGTTAGTRKVAEVPIANPAPELQAATATHFFFVDATSAGQELWASDGTAAGTRAVSSFEAEEPFGITHWLKPIGKYVYFLADDVTHGHELWRSDGTPQGTTRVTEFGYAFPFEGLDDETVVEELNGKVVLLATDGLGPIGLWTSTGTPSSTRRLSEVCANRCEVRDDEPWLRRLGNRLFFPVFSLTGFGEETWSTDGTASGSGPLIGRSVSRPTVLGDRLYFVAFGGNGQELWSSDGTAAGTHEATQFEEYEPFDVFHPALTPEIAAAGGRIWFAAEQSPYGRELWSTAGTPETTELAGDVNRGSGGSDPTSFAAFGDRVLFLAARCVGAGPAAGNDLWMSDGSASTRLSSFPPECYEGIDRDQTMVTSGGYGFFWRDTGEETLWRTDGTAAGTIPLAQFSGLVYPPTLRPVDGGVAFVVQSFVDGLENDFLWRSDGTVAGTVQKAVLPGFPDFAFADGQSFYFLSPAFSTSGRQVWRADLASGALTALTAFGVNEAPGNTPPQFTRLGNQIYFWLWPQGHFLALWRTDGTSAGTAAIFDLPTGAGYPPGGMSNVAGTLYFYTGVDYSSASYQLWRVDASLAGATRLATFTRRQTDPLPTLGFAALGGKVVFVGEDPVHGRELWSTDGTPEGTRLLRDVLPGTGSSSPSELTAAAGRVFFTAGEDVHGRELWQSDGSEAGTRLVHDIAPEALSSEPTELTVAGANLFFAADDGLHGREPWVLPLAGTGACVSSDSVLCLGGGRFRVEAVWRDFNGHTGVGHGAPLTADTGTFWFFSPSNVEVILKVLDGRGLNDHQWVFYGALSSVEYTLTVTDTQTGAVRRYFNPSGRLASVGDTEAFGPRGAAASRRASRAPGDASPPPIVGERRDVAAKSVCVPSATRLCLNDNRFAVEVAWRDFAGHTGVGTATTLSSDTGDFWFFGADNVELVVKVLDGRPITGKFWVFYGALSSVEYTLTVTDTQTGAVRTYTNPSGRLASVADTSAF